jgi:hypothetical protein
MLDNQQPTATQPNADLDAALKSFASYQPIQATASSLSPGVPQELTVDNSEAPELEIEETEVAETTEESPTEETTEEQELPSGFAEDFKKVFGIEPTEAIETFNSLIAFRDEVRLMGEWNVTPSEYQSRMSQIRDFFKQLPEDGQAQFNSVEGAVAIWNHLQQTGAPQKKTSGVRPSSKTTRAQPKAEVIKKSEVLRMDDRTLRANAARINKAVIEGRFIEDV